MANVFEFVAEARSATGSSAAKDVRRQGKVPAIIYGGNEAPEMLSMSHNELLKQLAHDAVYSHILDVNIDGKTEKAVLKHIQRHPSKPVILHVDFMRVSKGQKLKLHVPFRFINEDIAVGVKKGGIVTHTMNDVEVMCIPSKLPEFIEIDMANVDVGEAVHLSNVTLPEGVEITEFMHGDEHEHDQSVAQIIMPRAAEDAEAEADEVSAAPGDADDESVAE